MKVTEILRKIEALTCGERLLLFEKLKELTERDLPESIKQSMTEAKRGDLIDLNEALRELDPK